MVVHTFAYDKKGFCVSIGRGGRQRYFEEFHHGPTT